jgi:hypothetical protein
MRRDIKTGFPFREVERKEYRNVDRRLRVLWRLLRVKANAYGFGWNTLEPIKKSGPAAARYLAKYLGKAQTSEFRVGEERARLFGVWGRKRFVCCRFSWASSRIWRARLSWYADDNGLSDVTDTARLLGANWWLKLGKPLLGVILPIEYYQVWDARARVYLWDDYGWRAYVRDLSNYPEFENHERRVRHSRFVFYCADGCAMGFSKEQAERYAAKKLEGEFGAQRRFRFAERANVARERRT